MRSSIVVLYALLIYAGDNIQSTFAQGSTNYGDCRTPRNEEGSCIFLSDCPALNNVVRKGRVTAEERTHLQLSQCGYVDNNYLVCCPKANKVILPQPPNCPYQFKTRIVGGHDTEFDEYPWVALIEYTKPDNSKGFHCGGSLINNRYILTAAHCLVGNAVRSRRWRPTSVRLGEWDTRTNPDCISSYGGQQDCANPHVDVAIQRSIVHPNYVASWKNQHHDIALIRLAQSVQTSAFIKPICLPPQNRLRNAVYDRVSMDVVGWGKTLTANNSPVLQVANLSVWNQNECRDKFNSLNVALNDGQICAGGQQGIDSCNGDSGGPLFYMHKTDRPYYILAGVVSFGGTDCGVRDFPGVYTRVEHYMDWINDNLQQ